MEKIGIVTDEVADLPQGIVNENQIAVVPVKLFWPEIENMPGENVFQKMREMEKRGIKSYGKTSQPSMKDFLDAYKIQLEKFDKIICITLTSKLSGTYNSAVQARKFLPVQDQERIFVIDSLSGSAGQALLVLRAIDLIKQGKETEEIVKDLNEFLHQICFTLLFEDSKWMEAAGRISHLLAGFIHGMARVGIRPVIAVKDGVFAPAGLKGGAKDLVEGLFKQFETDVKKMKMENEKIRVVITHGDNLDGAMRLKEMIEKAYNNAKVAFINIVNNVVGAPAGPDALALAWCKEES